ncbi:MAG: BON domain-containing protein [Actinobacteria bacterium]|jgi:osmotically-inducible protein OsmY|nr:MAG: BON domain-containing protein [Actinomycetota bacterium]
MAEARRDIVESRGGAGEEEQEQRMARHHRHHHIGGPSFGRARRMRYMSQAVRKSMMGPMGFGHAMCPECAEMVESTRAMMQEEGPHRGKGPAAGRTDEQLKRRVEEVLTEDPWLDASNIDVSVEKGVVTLAGMVDSRASKRRAEDLTDLVFGVFDVDNRLRIQAAA